MVISFDVAMLWECRQELEDRIADWFKFLASCKKYCEDWDELDYVTGQAVVKILLDVLKPSLEQLGIPYPISSQIISYNTSSTNPGVISAEYRGWSGDALYLLKSSEDASVDNMWTTYLSYGSCSACDSILRAFERFEEGKEQEAVTAIFSLCCHLIQNLQSLSGAIAFSNLAASLAYIANRGRGVFLLYAEDKDYFSEISFSQDGQVEIRYNPNIYSICTMDEWERLGEEKMFCHLYVRELPYTLQDAGDYLETLLPWMAGEIR